MKLAALLATALISLGGPALAAPKPAPAATVERVVLPADVAPLRYEIRVRPDAERLTFTGHAAIRIEVRRPTDRIVLNAADLAFTHVVLSGVAAAPKVVLDADQQTAAFVFDQPLAPGSYLLEIDYSGRIFQQASGFFALDANSPAGKQRFLFTQFENSDARRFAPMWDEPGVKAVFSLTIEAPAGKMAVSNMPVAQTKPLTDGRTAVTFADTPKMSSYLLFLALGDFERAHRTVGPTEIGVIVRRGDAAKAQFALDSAADLLGYFNDYFGVPFPLPKLDLVAGPGMSQFFSAMENWGAVFVFDHKLLLDPATSTEADRQAVFTVIAHEMAHQWFGNLVTMAWWDDLWLNEGFASWMEDKATDHFHPEWRTSLQTMASRERAMAVDGGAGTHPVITPIRDVFAASDAFDVITYQKGQAVIRMLERYMGEDAFRAGVRAYIARYAYSNTTTDQLWAELDRVSPQPITQIAHDFTRQAGVPLIQAEPARDGLRLTQSRFPPDAAPTDRVWLTPVKTAATNSPPEWSGLVSRPKPQTAAAAADGATVVNVGQTGYFRTFYAPELWARLAPRFNGLAPADQLGLIYDSRALGGAGLQPLGDFLELARAADPAGEPIVLSALSGELAGLANYYPRQRGEAYRAFVRAQLTPMLARTGWEKRPSDSDAEIALRSDLIRNLGALNDPGVVAEAQRRFASSEQLTGSLRTAVQYVVARHAGAASWETLHGMARQATNTADRNRLYRLLGSSRDPELADRALALALSGEPPPTTTPAIIASVAALFPDKAYDFAIANRARVEPLLESTSRTIFFTSLASGSSDPAMLRKLDAFARTIPASSRGEVAKAKAQIERRRAFTSRSLPEIDRWLAAHPG